MTRRAAPIQTNEHGIVALARCSNEAGCQYRCDPKRNDGLCEWHGALKAYAETGDRDALFNRGLCGEDGHGPRIGQLCTIGTHHDECRVGRDLKAKALHAAGQAKLTTHARALGESGAE